MSDLDPLPGFPFEILRDAHVAALTGSLIDGVEHGPGGAGYVHTRMIPDPTLNFAYGVRTPEQFAWAGAMALGRARDPAFLARDADEEAALRRLFEPAAVYPASWMVAALPRVAASSEAERVAVHVGAVPPPEFEAVFANLSGDRVVRTHLRRHYLPALRGARLRAGTAAIHLVGRDAVGPVSCASLYLRGEIAGLYNVSTLHDRQGRGHGGRVTAAALREARARGAKHVFLQCPADGPVEALYRRAGFRRCCAPSLICTASP
ncbi:GNAT family N-acetyltransferase [Methylobacterium sp. NEAU 140]|uniref:GNAT family N-acetyltransferase n=1 Tax=Methylobacterium sp. NEAU 140 TaxID=3064945 RepID=UPI0027369D6B|nr:GNAT family N-acetyltransferase [Methylobacterium sp. NEAU 140]MDP4021018.1 GNAT family N-acetyltransferase [Methylobacterium sp. NEAU 140]